ncbi:MAG: hypothetical protein ACYTGL_18175 [Planctomycetota bacterium]|jgi:hypothetical protein
MIAVYQRRWLIALLSMTWPPFGTLSNCSRDMFVGVAAGLLTVSVVGFGTGISRFWGCVLSFCLIFTSIAATGFVLIVLYGFDGIH